MPSNVIGRNRSTALYQLIGLVYLFTVWPFVALAGLIGGVVYMLSAVILGLFFNRGLTTSGNPTASWSMRLFNWPIDQLKWIATGDGQFPLLP